MYDKISLVGISREEWLQLRKTGLGGTDAGNLCFGKYSNPMKVFRDKTSSDLEIIEKECLRQGVDFEDYVAQRFTEATGYKVRRSNFMYRSKKYPHMIADVDRLLIGRDAGLECKTCSILNKSAWSEGVPLNYLAQVYHYMIVLGKREWFVAVLFLGDSFKYYHILWDDEIADRLIEIETKFWEEHIVPKICSDPDGSHISSTVLQQMYSVAQKDTVIELIGFDEKLDKRNEIVEEISRLQKEQKQIEQEIQMFMKDNERANSERYKVSWSTVVNLLST